MPELVNSRVGSLPGTSGADGTMVWPRAEKNSRKSRRMSEVVRVLGVGMLAGVWGLAGAARHRGAHGIRGQGAWRTTQSAQVNSPHASARPTTADGSGHSVEVRTVPACAADRAAVEDAAQGKACRLAP